MRRIIATVLVAGWMLVGSVSMTEAATLTTNPGTWDTVITFGADDFANQTAITNQYSAEGVIFDTSSKLQYFTLSSSTNWAGITRGHIFNPYSSIEDTFEDLIMSFTNPVSTAGFNLRAGDATRMPTMRFTAYMGAFFVETFDAVVTTSNTAEQFHGFSGIIFDRIVVSMLNPVSGPPCCGANFDNLSSTLLLFHSQRPSHSC